MAKDGGNLVRLADSAVGIQEPFTEPVQRHTSPQDEVVAIFHLGKEQPILAAAVPALPFVKNGVKIASHFCAEQAVRGW